MSFSSRIFLLIVIGVGCLLAVLAYFAPYDPRLPLINEMVSALTAGRVTAVWLLPGCVIGWWADLWAAVWFGGCLAAWLVSAWMAGGYRLSPDIAQQLASGQGLAGWPVAALFVFFAAFFLVRRSDRQTDFRSY
jgi:hypothetical protein